MNYELLQSRANGQLDAQIAEVQTWIAQKVPAMTILALDINAMTPFVKQAHDAGIVFVSYAQSVPGSDKYRLRPDESGYDNLVLAGDWTDSGINAGCIEAAVISGLQAANALLGRGRYYRIRGFYMP